MWICTDATGGHSSGVQGGVQGWTTHIWKSWFAYTVCSLEQTSFLCPSDIPSLKQTTLVFVVRLEMLTAITSQISKWHVTDSDPLLEGRAVSAETPKGLTLLETPSRRKRAGRVALGLRRWPRGAVLVSIYRQGCLSVYTTNASSEASALECSVRGRWRHWPSTGSGTWPVKTPKIERPEEKETSPSHVAG